MKTLEAKGLVKKYDHTVTVDDVDLTVADNEVVGLLGANGAGKTTSFNMIIGLVRQTSGSIILDGEDITPLPMHMRARKGIGYLPQEHSIFKKLTAEQNILAILEATAKHTAEQCLKISNDLLNEFGIYSLRNKPAIQLSGGEQRRVEIARALALQPSFILLDEPFAGVDPIAVHDIQNIIQLLKNRGIGVLITDHNVRETLGICDRAYILHHGKVLVCGTPSEIMADKQACEVYLGQNFRL